MLNGLFQHSTWLDTLVSTFLDQQMPVELCVTGFRKIYFSMFSMHVYGSNGIVFGKQRRCQRFISLFSKTPNGVIMAPSFLTIISSGSENSIAMHLSVAFGDSLFKQI